MDMFRITAVWTGFNGAPGYSNFFFATGGGFISDAQQVAARVRGAFMGIVNWLPTGVTINIQTEVAIINSDTGMITGYETIDPVAPVVGVATGGYAAASGAVITWRTNDLRSGRRIRGRTFLIPLGSSAYQADGTLALAAHQDIQGFAEDLVGGDIDSEFGVWSRPVNGSGGVFATVVQGTVPDMAAVLRSRRD